jgi:hypothetical protein
MKILEGGYAKLFPALMPGKQFELKAKHSST